ncbi:MAG: phosphotransferase, partial [Planctomycetales bacterium]|nr:phosphotransferase [Planctomycetales bacterium]
MRISAIPQSIRNVKRTTEIISVLSKYGLAGWLNRLPLDQLGLDFIKGVLRAPDGQVLAGRSREARIRLVLTELGPVFIKLGQILSTRPDLIGVALADEFKQLQSNVPADAPQVVRRTVEEELGQPIDELFQSFDDVPLASASIGQVHRATLLSGEAVVVKVQHDGITAKVREDTEVLAALAHLAERIPDLAQYRPVEIVAEFQRALRRELDFGREERNLLHFAGRFADNPQVLIPKAHSDLCTPRVLTMDHVEGIPVALPDRLAAEKYDLAEVARTGAEIYLQMIFADGYYHADPHPGNIMVLPGNVIGLLDFGMVGRIDERLREDIEEMLIDISQRDSQHLATIITRIGQTPDNLDEGALANELADFVAHFGTQDLSHFD